MNTATATDSNRTAEADALDAIRIARRAYLRVGHHENAICCRYGISKTALNARG